MKSSGWKQLNETAPVCIDDTYIRAIDRVNSKRSRVLAFSNCKLKQDREY